MATVLLIIHIMIALALIGVVLLQRSEAVSYTHLTLPTILRV